MSRCASDKLTRDSLDPLRIRRRGLDVAKRLGSTLLVLLASGFGVECFEQAARASSREPDGTNAKRPTVPQELQVLYDKGEYEAATELAIQRIREHLGQPLPSLSLWRLDGTPAGQLAEFRGRPFVVFLAGTDCQFTLKWLARLRKNEWAVDGNAEVIWLVISPVRDRTQAILGRRPNVFRVDWPMADYLSYVRGYPALFWVSSDLKLVGFQPGMTGEKYTAQPPKEENP